MIDRLAYHGCYQDKVSISSLHSAFVETTFYQMKTVRRNEKRLSEMDQTSVRLSELRSQGFLEPARVGWVKQKLGQQQKKE